MHVLRSTCIYVRILWDIAGHGAKNDRMLTEPAEVIDNCDNVEEDAKRMIETDEDLS